MNAPGEERTRRVAARLEWPMLVAALLVIPVIAIEESSLNEPWDSIAYALNWVIWAAFLVEALIMLSVVQSRGRWLRSHPLEVAIILFTAPFLPASLQAARLFRLLRLLRLVRGLRAARALFSPEGIRSAAILAAFTMLAGGAAFAAVEKTDVDGHAIDAWDGVWWAVTTVTTVGYGDQIPRTDGGRVIAIVVMLVGIGFVALLTAAAAQRFVTTTVEEVEDEPRAMEAEVMRRLDDIADRLGRLEELVVNRASTPSRGPLAGDGS